MVNAQTDLPFYLGVTDVAPLGTLQLPIQLPPPMLAFHHLVQPHTVAEAAAKRKEEKYVEICRTHHFFPIAFETFGPINQVGSEFISALRQRLTWITDDPRGSSFLFQRLSVAVQRFNGICFTNSFGNMHDQFLTIRDTPRALISFQ